MNRFTFHNPTKIIFGEGALQQLSKYLPEKKKILLLYGGGSIKKNGVYDQAVNALKRGSFLEFGGIEPNPRYETIMKAVELSRQEKVDFILAVGGGSVIDAAKFMALAIHYTQGDPWEILVNKTAKEIKHVVPLATVLTLPATGSEMNMYSVISRDSTREKLSFGAPSCYPVFSILDPTVIKTIPQNQIANGITDAYTHVLEQYLTYPANAPIQDRFAESILKTLIEEGPKVMKNPNDMVAAGNFMWSATMALNGIISAGVPTDWATHAIGHELTALYGIDHARTLAIIAPNLYKSVFNAKKEKLAQYATRVWDVTAGTDDDKAAAAIEKTLGFFHGLGIKTKLSEYTADFKGTSEEIVRRFKEREIESLGENNQITLEKVREIVEMSY
ncbi:MAG: iron-containing alcohol dehydrogenase [Cyclobacteriaceae bacterium]